MTRRYIDVICLNDQEGNLKPLYIIWDDGNKIPITKITNICPRASLKAGGSGLRYTCDFGRGNIRHLYLDRGKWFVEMKD